MKIAWICLIGLIAFGPLCYATDLPRRDPESQGVSSAGVLAFVEAADKQIESMNSFMLIRHGSVVAEGWWAPYDAGSRHSLYSLSKSFTSTAVGIAIAEGKLSLDDEVIKFFPDDAPADPSGSLRSMRVSDLLRMSTGHQTEPARKPDEPWTKTFLHHPVPFKPGTHFLYNTSATYMLSAIVQKATGANLLEYLGPRLFAPLGIENPTWEMSPQGIATGGYGLSVRTEDIAWFGQLYLQKGRWNGQQLVAESWVAEATARQTSNGSNPASDWDQGYGYQFWRCRHGAYRGDGAFGQYCIVLPEQNAVIAITSGVKDMQAVLNLVWEKLLPALQPDVLPASEPDRTRLELALKNLSLPTVRGSAVAAPTAGKTFVFPTNDRKLESIRLEADTPTSSVALTVKVNGHDYHLQCKQDAWTKSNAAWGRFEPQPVAVTGAWTQDNRFTCKICFCETPFISTLQLKFSENQLALDEELNVGFGPTKQPPLVSTTE